MTTTTAALDVALLVKGRPTRTWSSDEGVVTVGSGEGMTIRARSAALHAHHCTLYVEGDQVFALAEGDAEILHNDHPAAVTVVEPGDVVRVGPLALTAQLRVAPPSPSPVPAPDRAPPPPASQEPVQLTIRLTDGRSRTVPLPEGRYLIGSGQAHLRIPGLAEQHAELTVTAAQVRLEAQGGPVHLAGQRIRAATLSPGAVASLGRADIWIGRPISAPAPKPEPPASAEPPAPPEPEETAPRASPPPAPEPRAKHPDDEDYDEELDFVEPFDLAAVLLATPAETGKPGAPCAAAYVRLVDGQVRETGALAKDESLEIDQGRGCIVNEGPRVVVILPEHARGILDGDERRALSASPPEGRHRKVTLKRGQALDATIGRTTWRIRADAPRHPPLIPNLLHSIGFGVLLGLCTVLSLATHGFLGFSIGTLSLVTPAEMVEEVQEEQFAEVEMKLQEPPEVQQHKATLQLSEKAPAVSKEEVTRASQQPRSENTTVSSLLTKLSASQPGVAGLQDQLSNIDAVAAAPGASAAFNLAGRLAAGSGVKVARSGTGAVQTAGQVGDDVGKLAAGARQGVRGKVTKLTSRMKVQGTLDPAEVTRVVNANMGKIQACYEREMMKTPGLAGRIVFDWTIATTGAVKGVRVQTSTMPSDVVANCISAEIKTWRFAQPTGGEALISYPFAFRSG